MYKVKKILTTRDLPQRLFEEKLAMFLNFLPYILIDAIANTLAFNRSLNDVNLLQFL